MKGSLVVAAEAAKGIGLIIVTPSLGVESSVFMFTTLFLDWLGNKPGFRTSGVVVGQFANSVKFSPI